jgi:hypothetical protein
MVSPDCTFPVMHASKWVSSISWRKPYVLAWTTNMPEGVSNVLESMSRWGCWLPILFFWIMWMCVGLVLWYSTLVKVWSVGQKKQSNHFFYFVASNPTVLKKIYMIFGTILVLSAIKYVYNAYQRYKKDKIVLQIC